MACRKKCNVYSANLKCFSEILYMILSFTAELLFHKCSRGSRAVNVLVPAYGMVGMRVTDYSMPYGKLRVKIKTACSAVQTAMRKL